MAAVVVLGAINVDLVVAGAPLPTRGETIVGGRFEQHQGGKGGNQAVAAARALRGGPLAGSVAMIGAVGDDPYGRAAVAALEAEGIDCSAVVVRTGSATGVALIAVDAEGDNQITVALGANATVAPADVEEALGRLAARHSIVLASLEVPVDAALAAGRVARALGARFVLNPAPALDVPPELLRLARDVTPNEHEVERLAPGPSGAEGAARRLAVADPLLNVVVTMGRVGVFVTGPEGTDRLPALRVRAVDTTGAGDAFNGGLAAALAEGLPLRAAVRRARTAAALATTRVGARDAMPAREEIDAAEEAAMDAPERIAPSAGAEGIRR